MLLDIEFTIKVTNDGDKNNETQIRINSNHKVGDFMTALIMAQESATSLVANHLSKNYGDIEIDQVGDVLERLTFREAYGLDLGTPPQPALSEEKDLYGETVRLTKSELQKLIDKHGKDATDQMIGKLDSYKKHSGKEYKSDYHAINNWVVDWYKAVGNKETISQ